MPELTVSVHVRGRVQGVFFRQTVREAADRKGVAGWIANREDGSVEAVLEGSRAAVEVVVEVCRSGPEGARVEQIDVEPVDPIGATDFRVD